MTTIRNPGSGAKPKSGRLGSSNRPSSSSFDLASFPVVAAKLALLGSFPFLWPSLRSVTPNRRGEDDGDSETAAKARIGQESRHTARRPSAETVIGIRLKGGIWSAATASIDLACTTGGWQLLFYFRDHGP
jgi:hypothetical protein